jgi:hypothetical protein
VTDVHQSDDTVHCGGIIDLESVVQSEGVDVHQARRYAGFGQDAKLRLDQVALGGDEQYAHLVLAGVTILVENLKVELDGVDIRNVLLGFPAHQLAGLRFLHALGLDALDDDVAAANGGDDRFGLGIDAVNRGADYFRHEVRIHHFTVDDSVVGKRSDRDLHQLGTGLRVIDDGDLHQARSNVDPYSSLLPAK